MPLPGGAAAKFGERYEGRWTVLQFAELLAEQAEVLCLEPPGDEGEGVEFWLKRGSQVIYHQAKRQTSRRRAWSIDDLGRSGVIPKLFKKLRDPRASCVFVSEESAGELRELTERALSAQTWERFGREFLRDTQSRTNFQKVSGYVTDAGETAVFESLMRLDIRTIDEASLRRSIQIELLPLVDGEASVVAAVLAQFALDNVHREVTRTELWAYLEGLGFLPRDWAKSHIVVQAFNDTNARYLQQLRERTICGEVLEREEAKEVVSALQAESSRSGVVLTGDAGAGKSGVILQVLDRLRRPMSWF